ncbi:unnamed protein product [Fraxinus pennsylvanica]|uniref:Uncharacterized protein n=1 Tax=Fraxinus pennsylvanica TaxID=56036 RepID=A0AAD2EBC2_9LAMI|nr:unnamed protein product [Fraxinus pennsylvanica]
MASLQVVSKSENNQPPGSSRIDQNPTDPTRPHIHHKRVRLLVLPQTQIHNNTITFQIPSPSFEADLRRTQIQRSSKSKKDDEDYIDMCFAPLVLRTTNPLEHLVKSGHCSVSHVFWDQDKPALITYPDLALNYRRAA